VKKLCPGCKYDKLVEGFAKNKLRKDGLQVYCRECKSRVDNAYYLRNKQEHYQRVRNYLLQNRRKLWEYLLTHPCADCGESDPVVLEFDHFKVKELAISNMLRRRFSWSAIEKEIEKCDVRCSNCHRRKTAKELGWYQFLKFNDKMGR